MNLFYNNKEGNISGIEIKYFGLKNNVLSLMENFSEKEIKTIIPGIHIITNITAVEYMFLLFQNIEDAKSVLLNIKNTGILDTTNSKCVVVFEPKTVSEVVEKYYQMQNPINTNSNNSKQMEFPTFHQSSMKKL